MMSDKQHPDVNGPTDQAGTDPAPESRSPQETAPRSETGTDGTPPLLSLTGITREFVQGGSPVRVLKGVDMSAGYGEFLSLQGTSGSGKSTLLHILGLLDTPTSGSYLLHGQDVAHMDDDQRSELRNLVIGFVFQSFHLVPYATALENVVLPCLYSHHPEARMRERAAELLDLVGLGDRMHFRPSQLSGGQQQRVALARALANDPDLILADEPTGQLDSGTSRDIMNLFRSVHERGKTVIIVTHDREVAANADRILRMEDGLIVADERSGA